MRFSKYPGNIGNCQIAGNVTTAPACAGVISLRGDVTLKTALDLFGNFSFPNKFHLKPHFCRALARKNAGLVRQPTGLSKKSIDLSEILCDI